MYPTSFLGFAQTQPATRPATPAQPAAVAPREAEASGLTRDEIRRIVLDLIG
ncbi:MAG: hypothetical protein ICV73_15945 [Acetobacteraceae bacterium]|nr:hypothetical protein [Acetobacteraceae bacterium]